MRIQGRLSKRRLARLAKPKFAFGKIEFRKPKYCVNSCKNRPEKLLRFPRQINTSNLRRLNGKKIDKYQICEEHFAPEFIVHYGGRISGLRRYARRTLKQRKILERPEMMEVDDDIDHNNWINTQNVSPMETEEIPENDWINIERTDSPGVANVEKDVLITTRIKFIIPLKEYNENVLMFV